MNRLFFSIAAALLCIGASAQQMNQQLDRTNPDLVRTTRTPTRHEIIIPDVDGFKVLKTELHSHTIYSDGSVSPEFRIMEAWINGLDAIAITDHIEYRPCDKKFAAFFKSPAPESVDLNQSVNQARAKAEYYGITLIPGAEITRNAQTVGHFNALFTTDNNKIPAEDPVEAIRNAKKQGAIVQSNHPGWARSDANLTEPTLKALSEGLIDGMECSNDNEFYQKNIEDAINYDLYICTGTDIHGSTTVEYSDHGEYCNMTFVLANDNSLESIKEALLAKRTLAYAYGDICGRKDMLEKFFLASLQFKAIGIDEKGCKRFNITNKSSLPFYLITEEMKTGIKVEGLSTVIVKMKDASDPAFTVMNMWYGIDKHPVITVKGI